MKSTTKTTENRRTENDDIKIIGKKFVFVINNDENTELTDTACIAFREWLKTPFGSKKYIDNFGIIPGGWSIDIANVNEFIHIGTAYDSITGGTVDIIYLKFENRLLNRIVYLDNTIVERGSILLPIDNKIEYVPFNFKYVNGTRKRTTKTSTANTKTDTKKTENKTPTKTPKTKKTTDKKVVTE
jgi:hypothetical protein